MLEDYLDVITENSEMARLEVMDQNRDAFIQIMPQMHQANSSRKWRLLVKNAIMEKSNHTLSTFTQFQVLGSSFWRAKMFVSGLKPDIFREEISSYVCESLTDAFTESRSELAVYYWTLMN
jgi:hypothetical protein